MKSLIKEFYWLNVGKRMATSMSKDELAYVSKDYLPVSLAGVTEKQKIFTIALFTSQTATLPDTDGFGVYLPIVVGTLIILGFAVYRYYCSKR